MREARAMIERLEGVIKDLSRKHADDIVYLMTGNVDLMCSGGVPVDVASANIILATINIAAVNLDALQNTPAKLPPEVLRELVKTAHRMIDRGAKGDGGK